MRKLLILIAVIGGVASIALCASYGWDQATVLKDQITAAFIYGMVAVFTLVLHVAAIRLWVNGWRKVGTFIGMAGFLAFVMTAFTSLGGLASRSDKVLAERQDVIDSKADTKRQIDELLAEKAGMKFTRTTQAAVDAAQLLANTAKQARVAECGNGDPKQRGRFCREKEDAEAGAVRALGTAQTNKASTDRFDEIEAELKRLRSQKTEGSVGAADPLKALLATVMGTWAELLTAWQKAVFAVIYDVCLIAVMIGIEVLGHVQQPRREKKAQRPEPKSEAQPEPVAVVEAEIIEPEPKPVAIPKPAKPKLIASNPSTLTGSVKRILTENLERGQGQKVEIAELVGRYRAVCKAEGKKTVSQDEFIADVDTFCKSLGIKRKTINGHVYLMDVQLVLVDHKGRELCDPGAA
jgi:hypothetical protein